MLSFGTFFHAYFCQHSGVYVKLSSLSSLSIFEVQIKGLYYFEIFFCVFDNIPVQQITLIVLFSIPPPAVEKGDMDGVRLCHCLRDLSILFSSLLTTSIIITIWKTKLKSFRQQRNGSQKSWQAVGEKMNLSIQQSSLLLKNWEWKSLRIESESEKIWEKKSSSPYRAFHSYPSAVELHCGDPPWPACGRLLPENG